LKICFIQYPPTYGDSQPGQYLRPRIRDRIDMQIQVGALPQEELMKQADGAQLLRSAMARLNWSARAYHRVLKVARTIADLAGVEQIRHAHIAEAVQYRRALTPIPSRSAAGYCDVRLTSSITNEVATCAPSVPSK
jgi:hypothetical protein